MNDQDLLIISIMTENWFRKTIFGPGHAKMCLMAYANNIRAV